MRKTRGRQPLDADLELFRAFLWDDHDETWPEDVHTALRRAVDRLIARTALAEVKGEQ